MVKFDAEAEFKLSMTVTFSPDVSVTIASLTENTLPASAASVVKLRVFLLFTIPA